LDLRVGFRGLNTDHNKKRVADLEHYRRLGGELDEAFVGQRVDGFLSSQYPFFSRSTWQQRLRRGDLLVNAVPVRAAYRLRLGDEIRLFHPPEVEPEVDKGVFTIGDYDGVVAVYKPANLPMHENGPYRKHTFAQLVKDNLSQELAAVHRLDRETSGIVICAESYALRQSLSQLFMQRRIEKTYLAIVNGVVKEDTWSEKGPIGDLTTSVIRIKKWVTEDGQEAETRFQVLARGPRHTLVAAMPKTGRTNQIRIHLAVRGHHLVGDKLYHPDEEVFLSFHEGRNLDWVIEQTGFARLCLHAAAIHFLHPESQAPVDICQPMPFDMAHLWQQLAK